jgi:hypothetical protein
MRFVKALLTAVVIFSVMIFVGYGLRKIILNSTANDMRRGSTDVVAPVLPMVRNGAALSPSDAFAKMSELSPAAFKAALPLLAEAWGHADHAAALKFANTLPKALQKPFLNNLLNGWAKDNFDEAWSYFWSRYSGDGPWTSGDLSERATAMKDARLYANSFEAIDELLTRDLRREIAADNKQARAIGFDAEFASVVARDDQAKYLSIFVGTSAVVGNGVEVASLADEINQRITDDSEKQRLLSEVFAQSKYGAPSQAVADWLSMQTDLETKNAGYSLLADRAASHDFMTAQALIAAIPDQTTRDNTATSLLLASDTKMTPQSAIAVFDGLSWGSDDSNRQTIAAAVVDRLLKQSTESALYFMNNSKDMGQATRETLIQGITKG